jgi:DNA-binding CsgD family transcriptional regulator
MIGREEERGKIDVLIADAREGVSGALVLRGEAGIGKSSLVEYAVDAARPFRLAQVAGVEAEVELSFAGLQRLLMPFESQLELLPNIQRDALTTALGIGPTAPTPTDRFLVGLATLSLMTLAATQDGLLCVVDDAQWLDRESLEVLAFVARRIYADKIVALFAVREPSDRDAPFEGITSHHLVGLQGSDALDLLALATDVPVSDEVAAQLLAEANGNPLAINEIAAELTAVQLLGHSPLPDPLPIGERLEARFLGQVRALMPEAQLVLLVAAAESSEDPDLFWRCIAQLKISPEGIASARDSGLLVLRPKIVFRHPLIRSAVYSGASLSDKRRVHTALAEATTREADGDRWAWHMAASSIGPSEEVASALQETAERGHARGGHSAVCSTFSRAAELTPDTALRAIRYLKAAEAAIAAGDSSAAHRLLTLSDSGLTDPFLRALAQRLRGYVLRLGLSRDSSAVLHEAARSLEPFDLSEARDTWLAALDAELNLGDGTDRSELRDIATSALTRVRGPLINGDDPSDLILDGMATRASAGYAEAVPLLRRALSSFCDERAQRDTRPAWYLLFEIAAVELLDDQALEAVLARLTQLSRDQGTWYTLSTTLLRDASHQVQRGQFERAAALFTQCEEIRSFTGQVWHDYLGIELMAWLGQEDATRAAAWEAEDLATRARRTSARHCANTGLSLLFLGQGLYSDALSHAHQVYAADAPRWGTPILPNLIEAAARSGDLSMASEALARLSRRAIATGTPLALGLLARSGALVDGDETAESSYRTAIEYLSASNFDTELARAHLLYGEWLRRQKRKIDARVELRTALDMFSGMGALAFAKRSQIELQATGETARRRTVKTQSDLTPQEYQIARLAARGATNPEIAGQMFLSSSTIDFHLRKVYRKLGVASRRQLAVAIQAAGYESSEPS